MAIVGCQAASYASSSSYSSSGYGSSNYGTKSAPKYMRSEYGSRNNNYENKGNIAASIQSRHSVQYYDVPSTGQAKPTSIEVGANAIPLNILFRSASSSLKV